MKNKKPPDLHQGVYINYGLSVNIDDWVVMHLYCSLKQHFYFSQAISLYLEKKKV